MASAIALGLLVAACTKKVPAPPEAGAVTTAAPALDAAAPVATAAVDAAPAPTLATTPTVHPAAHDAGVAMCCCQAGPKLANLAMTECVGSFHGSCVHNDICDAKSCCCDVGGKKTHELQTDCSHNHGKCVKKDQCS